MIANRVCVCVCSSEKRKKAIVTIIMRKRGKEETSKTGGV